MATSSYSISECCNAFTIVSGLNIICTNCQKIIGEVGDDDDIMIGVVYNPAESAMTTAKNIAFAPQLSQDRTCMLLHDHLCKKCNSPCRYILDASKHPIFLCSNSKCRMVSED